MADHADNRPVLFAYDGSEQAKAAIREAGRQLRTGRRAIVLTVWRPLATVPLGTAAGVESLGRDETLEREARGVAREGAVLAQSAGFDAEPVAELGDPVWQGIVDSADEHDAGIVVMGSHGRTGVARALLGSVAAAAARHTDRPVLIAHRSARRRSG